MGVDLQGLGVLIDRPLEVLRDAAGDSDLHVEADLDVGAGQAAEVRDEILVDPADLQGEAIAIHGLMQMEELRQGLRLRIHTDGRNDWGRRAQ